MWLLITAFAALVTTGLWCVLARAERGAAVRPDGGARAGRYKLGFLSLIYWGATLMWLVDHILGYLQNGGPFFEIDRDSTALGLAVLALGLAIWLGRLLFSRPRRVLRTVARK